MGRSAILFLLKMRRLVFITMGGVLCISEQTHAKFDGFYAGGSLGYLQQNTSINAAQNPANPNADVYKSTAGRAIPVTELFLGWGKVVDNRFYFGVEGQVDFVLGGRKNIVEDTNFIYQSGRKGPGFALLARIGYLLLPKTLVYYGVGTKLATHTYGQAEKFDQISANFTNRAMYFINEIGLEACAFKDDNIKLRFSYSYMPKREINKKSVSFPTNHIYHRNGCLKIGSSEHAFKIGVAYTF